jgi:HPr kinase/phosphorylase
MNTPDTVHIHATCIAVGDMGVLLMGKPGSGKSDLALRMIDMPGFGTGSDVLLSRLVSDDQVVLTRETQLLVARAPDTLKGRIEIRGLGIVPVPAVDQIQVRLVVNLVKEDDIERLPDPAFSDCAFLGVRIPAITLYPFAASAPAQLRAATFTYTS